MNKVHFLLPFLLLCLMHEKVKGRIIDININFTDNETLVEVTNKCIYPKYNCNESCLQQITNDSEKIKNDLKILSYDQYIKSESERVWEYYHKNSMTTTVIGLASENFRNNREFTEVAKIFNKLTVYSQNYLTIKHPVFYLSDLKNINSNAIYTNKAFIKGSFDSKLTQQHGKTLIAFNKQEGIPLRGHIDGNDFYISPNQHFKVIKKSEVYVFIPVADCMSNNIYSRY